MIREYSVVDRVAWNQLVCSFADFDVFYLNEYVSAFFHEQPDDGTPLLLYYQNGGDRAINVVFKRDIAKIACFSDKIPADVCYDLISPYGYGGFWGEISDYANLNREYNEYCVQNSCICEVVKFELFGDYRQHYDGWVESPMHNVIRNLEMPVDSMWMDFKQKVRKNVRRAEQSGLEIILDDSGEYLDDFLRIYYSTMMRNGAKKNYYFSERFFKEINEMKNHSIYFHASYKGKIVSTELVIYGTDNCYSYLGGTDSDYFSLRPNDFLKFEIIKWAHENGLKNFVLGGGSGDDDGIFQYKSSLAPHGIVDFYVGGKTFQKEQYDRLVELYIKDNPECANSSFFPLYRSLAAH